MKFGEQTTCEELTMNGFIFRRMYTSFEGELRTIWLKDGEEYRFRVILNGLLERMY